MSDMTPELGSDEFPSTPADFLNEALVIFTGCIGEALEGICSYGLTIGDSYVPFEPDDDNECTEEDAACSQAWVRVMGVQPAPGAVEGWTGTCAVSLRISLEVGVLRCIEIPGGGEAPTATDVMAAAMQAMEDMNAIFCAAMSCEREDGSDVWGTILVGDWVPTGPQGGQYGGTWTFTVEL